jgi:CheY-like chemotaxis protein
MRAAVEATHFPCRIDEASDGDAALLLAQKSRPDLVLLDIVLPDSSASGVLVCNQLCKDSRTKVVIISGQASKTIVQTCLNAGAIAFIPKPISIESLQEKVQEWLSE